MTFKFSHRTNWHRTPNTISNAVDSLKRQHVPLIDLTESNPTRCGFRYLNGQILKSFREKKNLAYHPDARGLLKTRAAVAQTYTRGQSIPTALTPKFINPNQIILTASTSEAYSFLFRLLANPGDEIVCPRPSYPLFHFLARLNDVRLRHYSLVDNGGWEIDMESLKHACGPGTKAILLVNPNNPTGSYVKPRELAEILKFAKTRKIALISDEVFSDFYFHGEKKSVTSLASAKPYLGFTLNGISKSIGLPQMKLAWIIASGEKQVLNSALERLEIIADTYLSVNTPAQNALPAWFKSKNKIQSEIKTRLNENRNFLQKALQDHACSLLKSEGGWYAVLRLPEIKTEEEWCLAFLKRDHVFVHPGYFFDFEREAYIVVSLLTPEKIFRKGIGKILRRIKQYS